MEIKDKVVIITGGASGIGAALAHRFADEGAAGVVIPDLDLDRAASIAREVGERALAIRCDVARESDIQALVQAARAVLPEMLARGEGYFLVTASAAGLLNIVETAPYGVTKHAAVAFAEWLRIAYGRSGIRVSCLCPQAVLTPMTAQGPGSAGVDGALTPDQVAQAVLDTMREERFLSLPHPEVAAYLKGKTQDYDRWLGGMQKLHARHVAQAVPTPSNAVPHDKLP